MNFEKLKNADHFDVIRELAQELRACGASIQVIHDSLSLTEIAKARKVLAPQLAKVEILKEIVKNKLSIMDGEWSDVVESVEDGVINSVVKSANSVSSLEDLI